MSINSESKFRSISKGAGAPQRKPESTLHRLIYKLSLTIGVSALTLGLSASLEAGVRTAPSCSLADVQNTVTQAANGDVVVIPVGTCAWTTTLTITKAIVLQGSGIGGTIIKDAVPGTAPGPLINWTCVKGFSHRMTGIEFRNGGRTATDTNVITIACTNVAQTTVRIDHNKFDHVLGNDLRPDTMVGVIDHNTFLDNNAGKYSIEIFDSSWNGVGEFGDNSWTTPVAWGAGDQFLFIEDNTFIYDAGERSTCTDGYRGARVVYRFNSFTNCDLAWHGTESTGRGRSGRAAEIYHNTFDDTTSNGTTEMFQNRDGSAVVWGNKGINLSAPRVAALFNYRAVAYFLPYGAADGTSPWDLNDVANPHYAGTATSGSGLTVTVAGAKWTPNQWAGYVIRKTTNCINVKNVQTCYSPILSNTADTITFVGTLALSTPPSFAASDNFEINKVIQTIDQPGRGEGSLVTGIETAPVLPLGWNDQIDFASYQWLNTNNGKSISFSVNPSCSNTCVANKNYYDYVASFNGSAGVGIGPIANRPVSCAVGVRYWATDQGEWWAANPGADGLSYKCVAKDSWQVDYTPYTYPHPLTAVDSTSDAPVPGNNGIITTSSLGGLSLVLNWTKATDAASQQSALQYEAFISTTGNIDTVANCELNGTPLQAFTPDIAQFLVASLLPGTTYYFNVVVKDGAGNEAAYTMQAVTLLSDAIAPTPGGAIVVGAVTTTSVALTWPKGSDDQTAQSGLQYEVLRSTRSNIETVAHALLNGTIVQPFTTNIGSINATGLYHGTTYYFTVIVKDAAGNMAGYLTQSATTVSIDTVVPIPGAAGVTTITQLLPTSLTLNWTKATDDVTPQALLQYEVFRSLTNNIGTVSSAKLNGTLVQGFTADINHVTVTGLVQATRYYFAVLVSDAAGNTAEYLSPSAITAMNKN